MTAVRSVESFVISSVKDHELPRDIEGLPLSNEELNALLENCPGVTTLPGSDTYLNYLFDESTTDTPIADLHQPSSNHQRSFQLVGDRYEQPWTDEHGNTYRALTLKGNNFSNPGIIPSATASNGFIPYGLQESEVIERVLKASQTLRERGISTEYIIGLAEPKQFPWPTIDSNTDTAEFISVGDYKNRVVEKYWKELNEETRASTSFVEVYQKFQEMAFYVSLRASDTAYRLADVSDTSALEHVYDQLNEMLPAEQHFTVQNNDDFNRYMGEYVAPRLAENFAKLHTDLAHGFPHSGNITAFGGIVDLDSVHGPGLGMDDEPVTTDERAGDIALVVQEIAEVIGLHPLRRTPNQASVDVMINFTKNYLHHVYKQHDNENEAIEYIGEFVAELDGKLSRFNTELHKSIRNQVLPAAKEYYFELSGNKIDAQAEFVTSLIEVIGSDSEVIALGESHAREVLPRLCEILHSEHINEINDAYAAGDTYVFPVGASESSVLHQAMTDDLLDFYVKSLAKRVAATGNGIPALDTITDDSVREMAYLEILSKNYELLYQACDDAAQKVIAKLQPEINSELQYEYPMQVFGDNTTHRLDIGLQNKKYSSYGDSIDWSEVEEYIESNPEIPVSLEPFVVSDRGEYRVSSSPQGRAIVEVATDSVWDSYWAETVQSDSRVEILIEFDEDPTYIVVVEEDSEGKQYLRILCDNIPERKQINFGDDTSTGPPEPGEQFTLF